MTTEWINGRLVEYRDDTHQYFVDGKEVPSVTQLVGKLFPGEYKDVDPGVLARAAARGTELHSAIEDFERHGLMSDLQEFRNYLSIKEAHRFEVVDNEKLIYVEDQGTVLCAGRLDMVIRQNDLLGLADIKRTYSLNTAKLKVQLNLYRIGYQQCYGEAIHLLRGIHLRNEQANFVAIPLDPHILQRIKTVTNQE